MRQGNLGALLQISRANLLLTSSGHATIGLFLAAGDIETIMSVYTLLFIAMHFSIAFFSCKLNCLYDHSVDKRYKHYMSKSLDIVGRDMVISILGFEAIIISALVLIFLFNGYYITGILAIIGFISGIIYSAEPIRLKKRGVASALPIMTGLYLLPILGGWFVFRSSLEFGFILFCIGYLFMNQGFTLVNTAEDYSEDKAEGIKTWAHVFGLRRVLRLAFLFSLIGLLCPLGIVVGFHAFGKLLSDPLFLFTIILSVSSILIAANEVHTVILAHDLEKSAKKHAVKLQRWFIMGRFPLMLTAIVLLF